MKSTFFWLIGSLALILLSTACGPDRKTQALRIAIVGEWHYEGSGDAGYEFRGDRSFVFWDQLSHDAGTWEINRQKITCKGREDTWSGKIDIREDTLFWGEDYFIRAMGMPSLRKRLVGTWILQDEFKEVEIEFLDEGRYIQYKGESDRPASGRWYLNGDYLVFNDKDAEALPVRIRGNSLWWNDGRYIRPEGAGMTDEELTEKIIGQWYTDELASGLNFTFFPNRRFSSFDGRFESNGSWEIKDGKLILDQYEEAAEPIRFDGENLQWGPNTFTRMGE